MKKFPTVLISTIALGLAGSVALASSTEPRPSDPSHITDGVALDADGQLVALNYRDEPAVTVLPGTRILYRDSRDSDLVLQRDIQWLARGEIPGRTPEEIDAAKLALLDMKALQAPSGGPLASTSRRWLYVWPRDAVFVAVAFAKTGHHREADATIKFLAQVQDTDGGFQARYLADGKGTPDDRVSQSDGCGWTLWALSMIADEKDTKPERAQWLHERRSLVHNCVTHLRSELDPETGLPKPSSDYWERQEEKLTLGIAAAHLMGWQHAARIYRQLELNDLASDANAQQQALRGVIEESFGAQGYTRWIDGTGGSDSAITFLLPPFVQTPPKGALTAWQEALENMRQPAGGVSPGEAWRKDGVSWTPETALFAYTGAHLRGQNRAAADTAEELLDWLIEHRTPALAYPEKVLRDGSNAGPAPLNWTTSLVVLTMDSLQN